MALSLNRVQLIGNLTRDPEMKQIPSGKTVTSFSIATNFSWTDASGQKQDKPEYHNIVVWGKLAEIAGQYLRKGTKVFVEGRLQTREWEGEDNVKRYRTEIVLENMIMLTGKGGNDGAVMTNDAGQGYRGGISRSSRDEGVSAPVSAALSEDEVTIDDLPF